MGPGGSSGGKKQQTEAGCVLKEEPTGFLMDQMGLGIKGEAEDTCKFVQMVNLRSRDGPARNHTAGQWVGWESEEWDQVIKGP